MSKNNQIENENNWTSGDKSWSKDDLRELGSAYKGYIREVESQKFIEERPEFNTEFNKDDGILFVGTAANGRIVIISDNEERTQERMKELEYDIEHLH
jgi:hypothetical protein